MKYISDSYRRSNGKILTTTNGVTYSKYDVDGKYNILQMCLSKYGL